MKNNPKLAVWLISALLLVAVSVATLFTFFWQLKSAADMRQHTYVVLNNSHSFISTLRGAETNLRGFLLTHDETFLQPFMEVRENLNLQLEKLHQLAKIPAAQAHLNTLTPLIEAKLTFMERLIELARNGKISTAVDEVRNTDGGRMMEAITIEMNNFIKVEEAAFKQYDTAFQSQMRRLFGIIVFTSLFVLLFAATFVYFIYRNSQQRIKNLVHLETKQLLDTQEALNQQLQQAFSLVRDQQFYTRSLIESNIDALITTDPAGIISDVNKQMEELTGCSRDELIGAPFKNCFTDPEHAEAGIKRVLKENKVTNYELTARARDGKQTVVSYNATTFYDRDQNLQGVFAAARDVTERKHFDRELEKNNIELEKAKSAAEKANLAKSDFLSSMSHELRTPLSAILGFAQLIEAGNPAPSPVQKRSLDQILQAGWYLLDLINEILDLALIESGKLSLSMEPVSLAQVMQECATMIEPQAHKRGINVSFPPFDILDSVYADHTRVKQVLINLLSNAIKYNCVNGTVVITCKEHTPGRLRITVADTGDGLSPEKIAQLFQPFNRLGQESMAEEGTGIGLVMTKRLIELMGGTMGLDSIVGKGSNFWIELNSTADKAKIDESQPIYFKQPEPTPGTALRTLLYVEDNPANLMLVENLIARRRDIHLFTAHDGNGGVTLARKTLPDVILMDINLPGISGIDALKLLRTDPITAHIPVVALSANAMPADIEKGLQAGFYRYLTKPIKVDEFMQTLELALKFTDTLKPPNNIEIKHYPQTAAEQQT